MFNKYYNNYKNKKEMQNFLDFHRVEYRPNDTNAVLKDLILEVIEQKNLDVPVIEDICRKVSENFDKRITILWLPPYHSMLNSIELYWAQMKGFMRKIIKPDHKIQDIMNMAHDFAEQFRPDEAQKLLLHTEKEERKFRYLLTEEFPIQIDEDLIRMEINMEEEEITEINMEH